MAIGYLSPCEKGCSRRVLRWGTGAYLAGASKLRAATRIATPAWVASEYRDMISRTGLVRSPPRLEFYDDLHGVGGIHSSADSFILIGMRDMEDIAAAVTQRWPAKLLHLFLGSEGRWPTRGELPMFATRASIRRCIAHEIGHALLAARAPNPFAPDDEAGADFYAGKLDASVGRSRNLGAMFFHAIGCTGSSCTHPAPAVRVGAYTAGYDAQRRGL